MLGDLHAVFSDSSDCFGSCLLQLALSGKRNMRRGIEFCSALLGTFIVLAAVLFVPPAYLQMQTIVTVVGILILQVGVWSLTRQVRVGERHFVLLREETQHFLRQVPALNASAVGIQEGVEEEKECFQATLKRMRASVTRMSEVAGEDNLPPVERNVG